MWCFQGKGACYAANKHNEHVNKQTNKQPKSPCTVNLLLSSSHSLGGGLRIRFKRNLKGDNASIEITISLPELYFQIKLLGDSRSLTFKATFKAVGVKTEIVSH